MVSNVMKYSNVFPLVGSNMKQLMKQMAPLPKFIKLNKKKKVTYKPSCEFTFTRGSYILTVANDFTELEESFRFRAQVFKENLIDGTELDFDSYDFYYDHLIIRHKETKKVCGTYRMCSQETNQPFYSQDEFDLDEFLKLEGNKIELGRAAICEEHRNGTVLDLLWRGIASYAKIKNARYMFGCASIMSESDIVAHMVSSHLIKNPEIPTFSEGIRVRSKYKVKPLKGKHYLQMPSIDVNSLIPALLTSYIRAGASICPAPAMDRSFKSIDYAIILDMEKLSPLHRRRYFNERTR